MNGREGNSPFDRLIPTGRDSDRSRIAEHQISGIDNGYRFPLRIFGSVAMNRGRIRWLLSQRRNRYVPANVESRVGLRRGLNQGTRGLARRWLED
jgi:hypothetical protein